MLRLRRRGDLTPVPGPVPSKLRAGFRHRAAAHQHTAACAGSVGLGPRRRAGDTTAKISGLGQKIFVRHRWYAVHVSIHSQKPQHTADATVSLYCTEDISVITVNSIILMLLVTWELMFCYVMMLEFDWRKKTFKILTQLSLYTFTWRWVLFSQSAKKFVDRLFRNCLFWNWNNLSISWWEWRNNA